MICIPQEHRDSADSMMVRIAQRVLSAKVRTLRQFAEDEIFIPYDGGPHEGEKFDPLCQPYVDLLYEEIENGGWSEIFITGPSQSGKTLCAFVIVVIYIAAELRKNVIVGVPIGDMIDDKWSIDIAPTFRASPTLAKLLPDKGPGSKDGKVTNSVTLKNGVTMKFMTKGGSDTSKAAFTASKAVVTEAPAWSEGVSTSDEPDPLAQIRARQKSKSRFGDDLEIDSDRQMIVEGTTSVAEKLPWRMKKRSSDSKIVAPCPHCKTFVAPERENFGGYEDCTNELDAAVSGSFFCPSCSEAITDKQRIEMVRKSRLIHKGQTIDKRGRIKGAKPKTSVLFFRWSAFQNLFLKSADFAADEWKVLQIEEDTADRDDAEREQCMFVWATPYEPKEMDAAPLDRGAIRKRTERFTVGVIPPNTQHLVFGVDVGRWRCWYYALALRSDGTIHTPLYGAMDTTLAKGMDERALRQHEGNAIASCLHQIFDLIEAGWAMPGGDLIKGDLTLVDTRYATTDVFKVIKARGTSIKGPFMGVQGVGQTQLKKRQYTSPRQRSKTIRKIGERYHIEYAQQHRQNKVMIDVDDSKMSIQRCLRVSPGVPGALTLPMAPQSDHKTVSHHLASEVYRQWKDKNGKLHEEWKQSGANHWLDCAGYAWVAGKILGWKIPNTRPPEDLEPAKPKPRNIAWLNKKAGVVNAP